MLGGVFLPGHRVPRAAGRCMNLGGASGMTVWRRASLFRSVVAACAALWAFATRSALRAWVGILAPTLLMAGISRLLGAWA